MAERVDLGTMRARLAHIEGLAADWERKAGENLRLAEGFAEEKACFMDELDRTRVQLAGCLTAAEGATQDQAEQGDYGWSLAYQKVLELRIERDHLAAQVEAMRTALSSCPTVSHRREGREQFVEIPLSAWDGWWDRIHDALSEAPATPDAGEGEQDGRT